MNPSNDHRLDRLLEDWADKTAASEETLTTLRQQIGEQHDSNQPVALGLPPRSTATRRYMAVGLAVAAALFMAVGTWLFHSNQQPMASPLHFAGPVAFDSAASFEAHWRKHLLQQQRLLSEYQGVFGQNVSWVTETKQGCDVGLATIGVSQFAPSEYVVIQLWLVARNQQGGQSEVHAISILVGREELVEIPAAVGGGQLMLWAHPVDEEMISIDLRYQPTSVAGVQIENSHLQRVGQVTNIHSFEQDGIEYQLYQAADLIHHKLG